MQYLIYRFFNAVEFDFAIYHMNQSLDRFIRKKLLFLFDYFVDPIMFNFFGTGKENQFTDQANRK